MTFAAGLLSLIAGIWLGDRLPDIDQHTSLLVHRSVITHGPLVPFLLFLVSSSRKSVPVRLFVMGLCAAFAVHLGFDLFPKAWTGFALIHIPEYGWTSPLASGTWIALSGFACVYMALRLVRNGLEGTVLAVGLAGSFLYAATDEDAMWRPLLAVTTATIAALVLAIRRRPKRGRRL
ncbi:MAG: hypothetical protein O3A47_07590 [Chloroflexi bacterium]|nr:hypothetical protein [Chloroflexota bacterium]